MFLHRIFTIFLFTLMVFSVPTYAEGPVYSGTTKTVDCNNPVTRTDGTALDPSEIASVEVYIRTSPTGSPEHTVIMPGGCQPMTLDLTTLSEGQKHMDGIATDTEGRASVLSANPGIVLY